MNEAITKAVEALNEVGDWINNYVEIPTYRATIMLGKVRDVAAALTALQQEPAPVAVKELDLASMMKHAFYSGQTGVTWVEYDPAECPAYERILSAFQARKRVRELEATIAVLDAAMKDITGVGFDAPAIFAGSDAEWERKRANIMQTIARAALGRQE